MKGFRLPIISRVPVEIEGELNKAVEKDVAYSNLRQEKLKKLSDSPTSVIRKVGDYLLMNYTKGEMSYNEIADALDLSEAAVKIRIGELNFYRDFPLTMIPVPKKPGYIQSCLRSETDYENWDLKKQRTIVSMEGVREKAKKTVGAKNNIKQKEKQKEKEIEVKNV